MDNVVKRPLKDNKLNKHSCPPMPAAVVFKPSLSGRPRLPKINNSFESAYTQEHKSPLFSREQNGSVPKPNTVNYNISCVQTLGMKPSTIICPSCNNKVVTQIKYKPNLKTHFLAALLCLSFCFFMAPLPYMVKSCKSVEHYCPLCNAYIGSY